MGRAEFAEKTGINKGTLIGIETTDRGVISSVLTAIAKLWPQYAAYLLIEDVEIKQKNPEIDGIGTEEARAKKVA